MQVTDSINIKLNTIIWDLKPTIRRVFTKDYNAYIPQLVMDYIFFTDVSFYNSIEKKKYLIRRDGAITWNTNNQCGWTH